MAYMHAIAAGHLEWAVYAVSLLAGALPDDLSAIIRMRGFGRRGFGGRGFGRGLGPFRLIRLIRLLFVLLFTTVLGPVVLVALVAFVAYWFFTSRRGR